MDWSELPCDIKRLIFDNNRSWTNEQIQNNKEKYNNVIEDLDTLNNIVKRFHSKESGFGEAMLETIMDLKIQVAVDKQDQEAFDNYYGIDDSSPEEYDMFGNYTAYGKEIRGLA